MKIIKDEYIGLRITSEQSNDLKALCGYFRVNRSEVLRLAVDRLVRSSIGLNRAV
jgi:hypothetical protein